MRSFVLLHCAANSAIGVGHLRRVATLASELAAVDDLVVTMIVEADEVVGTSFPIDDVERVLVKSRVDARAAITSRLAGAHSKTILVTDLLDVEVADQLWARSIGCDFLVHLGDAALAHYRADLHVIGNAFESPATALVPFGNLLSGAEFHLVAPSVGTRRPAMPWRGTHAQRILVTLGGADPGEVTEALIRNSTDIAANLTVVIGPAVSEKRRVAMLETVSSNMAAISDCADLADLMLSHDLVVTLGGVTSYEAMCLGRPVACVEWAAMTDDVRLLDESGLVANLGTADVAATALQSLITDEMRLESLAEAGFGSVDGKGAQRVAREIVKRSGLDSQTAECASDQATRR